MSHGAKPVAVALLGFAALLTAGAASAACPGHPSQSVQAPSSDSVASSDQKAPKAPVDRRG